MDRGLYTATSGGLRNMRQIDVTANNLANVNTVGYKAERLISRQQQFSDTLASMIPGQSPQAQVDHEQTPGVIDLATKTDFTPGPVSTTGNPLDVALRAHGQFFVVQTPNGEAYTRAGNFTLNAEGGLITPDGMPVLGEAGPITLPSGDTKITSSGTIVVDGQAATRLRVVEFADTSGLVRQEGVRFTRQGGPAPVAIEAEVVPGAVEMANVETVEAMVEMISAQRAFEAYTKTAKTIDELNDRATRSARMTG